MSLPFRILWYCTIFSRKRKDQSGTGQRNGTNSYSSAKPQYWLRITSYLLLSKNRQSNFSEEVISKNRQLSAESCRFLCLDYEIAQINDISPYGDMIYGFAVWYILALLEYDIISVPSYAAGVYHRTQCDIIPKVYHPFRKERISL